MSGPRALGAALTCAFALLTHALVAQEIDPGPPGPTSPDAHRIWGRVRTVDGEVHEGFIRWDRNEGSWSDVLDGTKVTPDLDYRVWLAANEREPAMRTIVLRGYRISWDEDDPDFRARSASGIRFGHLAALTVGGRDSVDLVLRSGEHLSLTGGASDIGTSIREILVDVPGADEIELRWRELERIDFSAPPADARARGRRLFGTVEDELGRPFTGWIAWDLDEILDTDVLDGEEMRGRRARDIPFSDIARIERIQGGARVTLRNGSALDLTGSNDVDDGHRGVQISDPALGMVEVEWPQFRSLQLLEPPDGGPGYETFEGGSALRGSVVTESGEELTGLIRWDADEAFTWELLNGDTHDVALSIELGFVDRIERGEAFGSTVVLRDGRSFELEGASDVDWDNRGIMVAEDGRDPSRVAAWRLVQWDDLREVRFHAPAEAVDGRGVGR